MGTPTCKGSRDNPHVECSLQLSTAQALLHDFGAPLGTMTSTGNVFQRKCVGACLRIYGMEGWDCNLSCTAAEKRVFLCPVLFGLTGAR